MSWASERQAIILALIGAVVLVIAAGTLFSILYETPSCTDGIQNADETGIDCGGSCAYLCTPSLLSPSVTFVRALTSTNGRTDIVAYVENPNTDAEAVGARFVVELYGADHTLLARVDGTADLPPSANVPIFLPNVYGGSAIVQSAFLSFDPASLRWRTSKTMNGTLVARDVRITEHDMPRIVATIENASPEALLRIPVIAIVFDGAGTAIAASRTLVNMIPAQGSAEAVFTWSEPFTALPGRIDVRPVTLLAP